MPWTWSDQVRSVQLCLQMRISSNGSSRSPSDWPAMICPNGCSTCHTPWSFVLDTCRGGRAPIQHRVALADMCAAHVDSSHSLFAQCHALFVCLFACCTDTLRARSKPSNALARRFRLENGHWCRWCTHPRAPCPPPPNSACTCTRIFIFPRRFDDCGTALSWSTVSQILDDHN